MLKRFQLLKVVTISIKSDESTLAYPLLSISRLKSSKIHTVTNGEKNIQSSNQILLQKCKSIVIIYNTLFIINLQHKIIKQEVQ